jgi:prevent-host-death family protein
LAPREAGRDEDDPLRGLVAINQPYQWGASQLGNTPNPLGKPCSSKCYSVPMSTVITQRELRNDNAEIMRRLDEGESFIVTSNGRPVGELNPLHRPRFVSSIAAAAMFSSAPPIDAKKFRKDIDSVVDQEVLPRA